jgi:hypothetical protein
MVGVDTGGLKYDGELARTEKGFHCSVVYIVPAGASLITGSPPASTPQRIQMRAYRRLQKAANDRQGAPVTPGTPLVRSGSEGPRIYRPPRKTES